MGCRGARLLAVPIAALTCVALAASCGQPASPSTATLSPAPSAVARPLPSGRTQLLAASATVLDLGEGPILCVGAVAASLPPAGCGGVPLTNWVWPKKGVEHYGRGRWGEFDVVGTYDGKRFTFARVITEAQATRSLQPRPDPDFTSACPEPSGGWQAPDPSRATTETTAAVFALATKLPGYAGSWLDRHGEPGQNPVHDTVNVQVTKDRDLAEQRLRVAWGGPLCVTTAAHSTAELQRISNEVARLPGHLFGYDELSPVPGSSNRQRSVYAQFAYADDALQERLDSRYGRGMVTVTSALMPYIA